MTSSSSLSDDVAHQLLGWSSNEHATSLQSRATHDTKNNLDSFRRAVDILSSKRGQLSFAEECGAENGVMNPLLVVKGYCRLIKCSLAAAAAVDLSKDAGDLLKQLGTKLNAALQEQIELKKLKIKSTKQADITSKKATSLRNKAILFYFKFIEDVVNAQITKHIRLLGPTYRSVCDVAASFGALVEAEKNHMDAFVGTFLPSIGWEGLTAVHNDATRLMKVWKEAHEFFDRAILYLLSLLDTYLQKTQQVLVTKQRQTFDASTETISRVATFLLARITSLLVVNVKELGQATKLNKVVAAENDDCDNYYNHTLMRNILSTFVKISCLSLVAKENLAQSVDKERAFLEAIVGLGSKAGNSLGKIFCQDLELPNESAISAGLDCLVEVTPDDGHDSETVGVENETTFSLKYLFPLGKISLVNMVLAKLFASTQTPQIKIGSMSTFFEALLFEDVPKCYHLLASDATPYNQASEVLRSFVDVLESAAHFFAATRGGQNAQSSLSTEVMYQHHVLVRWMYLSWSNPLSNELLLRAIQSMILSSCSANDQNWNHDASSLISLMSQLMFHKETDSSHRRNISVVLIRLLSSSTQSHASELAKSLTIEVLWREFAASSLLSNFILFSSNVSRRLRKRKRSQNWPNESFLPCDIQTMCCVLESLASAVCKSQLDIDMITREKIKSLWEEILSCQVNSWGLLNSDENDCRTFFLLSISVGLLKGNSSVANFLRMIGEIECSPAVFVEKTLSFIEAHVGSVSEDEIYNSMTLNLCSSLMGVVLTSTDGDELSENFVSRTGNIVKCISNFAVKKTSAEAISLQRCVVALVCNVGIQIQSGCSRQAVECLAGSISCILEKSSWYHISPNLSCLECFIKQHPSHLTLLLASTPTSVKSLLASRVQGKIFSIVDDKVIDASQDAPYSTFHESLLLQDHCNDKRRSILATSCFGSESLMSCPRCGFCLPRKMAKN